MQNRIIARSTSSSISLSRHFYNSTNYYHYDIANAYTPNQKSSPSPSLLQIQKRTNIDTTQSLAICHYTSHSDNPERSEQRQQRRQQREIEEHDKKNQWRSHNISISDQFIESASSYISTVRLMVASRLTSSLPDEDRIHLLRSLNVNAGDDNLSSKSSSSSSSSSSNHDTNTTSTNPRTSIGEAVAVIEATEAFSSSKRNRPTILTEDERRSIWKKAEKAAMERVNSDLLVQERRFALERWKIQLEEERQNDLENEGFMDDNDSRQRHALDEEDSNGDKVKRREETQIKADTHPVLGPVLVDLGYKRIHVTTARTLCAVPVWEKQRVYRHDRAKLMASDKLKSLELGLPGIIALHESKDGQLAILDGQHRVGMMAILEEKSLPDNIIYLDRVLVEVFPNHHYHHHQTTMTTSITPKKYSLK